MSASREAGAAGQEGRSRDQEEDRETVRAAAVAELESLTASLGSGDPLPEGTRYKDAWDEKTWEQDFDSHPLFMQSRPEDPANLPPLVEAMRQLKYDAEENSADELAERYKREGNENFRLKKYRWAVDNYTAGIQAKPQDQELASSLFGNRAAAHLRLGNNRSALADSRESVQRNKGNSKSVVRVADCLLRLQDYRSCIDYCHKHVLDHAPLESFLREAQRRLQQQEREAQIKQRDCEAEAQHREALTRLVTQERGIDTRCDLFHSGHPAAAQHHVQLSEEGHLVWPVIFVYPEYSQTDFIQFFDEESTFRQQLLALFGDEDSRPAWDTDRKYQVDRLRIAFPRFDDPSRLVPVAPEATLRSVLSSSDFVLTDAVPVFSVVSLPDSRKSRKSESRAKSH